MLGAASEEIMKVIDRYPSSALSYRKVDADAKEATETAILGPSASIKVLKIGLLLAEGSCRLINKDGNEAASCGPFALCRCGGSKKSPSAMGRIRKLDLMMRCEAKDWQKRCL